MNIFKSTICALALILIAPLTASASPESATRFGEYAYSGQFREGIAAFAETVSQNPDDMEAKFALGALQFFSAIDGLQRALYRYGAGNALAGQNRRGTLRQMIPILRLPVPANPAPELASYKIVRQILTDFVTDLDTARSTLATIQNRPVKLPLSPFRIAVDLDRNGKITREESMLGALMALSNRRRAVTTEIEAKANALSIVFDTADVSWLQGYANALMAVGKFFLAFDFEETYETSFQVIFGAQSTRFGRDMAKLQPLKERVSALTLELGKLQAKLSQIKISDENRKKIKLLRNEQRKLKRTKQDRAKRSELFKQIRALELTSAQRREKRNLRSEIRAKEAEIAGRRFKSYDDIFDLVAFIHTLNWKVVSPQKLADVRLHLLEVMRLNRVTWQAAMTEKDNDREWLPNAKQDAPFPGVRVTQATIDNWLNVVGFAEDVLEGKKLIPHARFTRGINLKKFFEGARRFDLVMFLTGPSAMPYLESEGEVVSQNTWRALTQPFNRNFGLFMVWFN